MSKGSPTTYKISSIGEFAAWTKGVVLDPTTARDVPKKWFDSEKTAAGVRGPIANDFDEPSERRKWLPLRARSWRDAQCEKEGHPV